MNHIWKDVRKKALEFISFLVIGANIYVEIFKSGPIKLPIVQQNTKTVIYIQAAYTLHALPLPLFPYETEFVFKLAAADRFKNSPVFT